MERNPLRTKLCDMLDIKYPIILAGMGGMGGPVSGPELVAAVSNAGGLGILGCAFLSPRKIDEMIRKTKRLTDKPFGVDTIIPPEVPQIGTTADFKAELQSVAPSAGSDEPDVIEKLRKELGVPAPGGGLGYLGRIAEDTVWSQEAFKEQVEVIMEHRVPVWAAALGDPAPYEKECHARGIKIIGVVASARGARRLVKSGADIIAASGAESGGHNSRIGTMVLIPQVVDAVSPVPVVAGGGIGDGRGLVAALALGAVGVWCGTVFLGTHEAIYEDYHKQKILESTEDDTMVSKVITGKQARYLKNRLIEAWDKAKIPTLPMPMQSIAIIPILDGAYEAKMADIIPAPAGQIVGMIKDLKPAKQVVEEMVAGALQVLDGLPSTKVTPRRKSRSA
ncbi:MAG TPA: nitronate monooxygenase [Dehalococcoidia bacterium]|nr:nitronate monooxygenase [Dehalococcoidia bacterium]